MKAMSTLQNASTPRSSHNVKKRRTAPLIFALSALLILTAVCALLLGSARIDLSRVISALIFGDTSSVDYRIFAFVRLPRVFAAILAGAALAVSGVIIQAVLNNPMAAPNIIGVNSGAGFCAILCMSVFPHAVGAVPIASFFGALAACLLIYAVAARTGAGRVTVTLVGIAVGSILSAGTNTLKLIFPDSVYDADVFMIGGLSGVGYAKLLPAAAVIFAGLVCASVFCRGLDVLTLGGESAASLGMNVRRSRFLYLTLASALAGAAVSFAGLIGFVGLLVPHIMRRFVGTAHARLVPASALGGALLVLLCDLFARTAFAPYELSVGIILSFVGGPFFIFLVLAKKRGELL